MRLMLLFLLAASLSFALNDNVTNSSNNTATSIPSFAYVPSISSWAEANQTLSFNSTRVVVKTISSDSVSADFYDSRGLQCPNCVLSLNGPSEEAKNFFGPKNFTVSLRKIDGSLALLEFTSLAQLSLNYTPRVFPSLVINATQRLEVGTFVKVVEGKKGSPLLKVTDTNTGFSVGDDILIHQTTGTEAGDYDLNTIDAILIDSFQLHKPLSKDFTDGAQAVKFEKYALLTLQRGAVLTSKAWDGNVGGILAVRVLGRLSLNNGGAFNMSGKGYRGGDGVCTLGSNVGKQGESPLGLGIQSYRPNGGGGGGGDGVTNVGSKLQPPTGYDSSAAGGGGGAYFDNGFPGTKGIGHSCGGCGGYGGVSYETDLAEKLFFGSGGGAGGGNQGWKSRCGGGGGSGGGIIVVDASEVVGVGVVSSEGISGTTSKGGGGGAGAGGSILFISEEANGFSVEGGTGGGGDSAGGDGGVGRSQKIRLEETVSDVLLDRLGFDFSSQTSVSWRSSKQGDSALKLSLVKNQPGLDFFNSRKTLLHQVSLGNVSLGTRYYLKINSTNVSSTQQNAGFVLNNQSYFIEAEGVKEIHAASQGMGIELTHETFDKDDIQLNVSASSGAPVGTFALKNGFKYFTIKSNQSSDLNYLFINASYDPAEVKKAGLEESLLRLYAFNPFSGNWESIEPPEGDADIESKTVWANSSYGEYYAISGEYEEIYIPPEVELNPNAKEFKIVAEECKFTPANITVSLGEDVRFIVRSIDVLHGFSLPEFNLDETLEPGKDVIMEFNADQEGAFTFRSNVPCRGGSEEMAGTFTVLGEKPIEEDAIQEENTNDTSQDAPTPTPHPTIKPGKPKVQKITSQLPPDAFDANAAELLRQKAAELQLRMDKLRKQGFDVNRPDLLVNQSLGAIDEKNLQEAKQKLYSAEKLIAELEAGEPLDLVILALVFAVLAAIAIAAYYFFIRKKPAAEGPENQLEEEEAETFVESIKAKAENALEKVRHVFKKQDEE